MAIIGSVINNRYIIEKEIGQGGMSTVYLARDQKLNVFYALKEIQKETENEIITETSMTEVNLLKDLNNRHIPRVIDIIDAGVNIFVVQDFIQGRSLDDILEEQKKVPQEIVVEWMKQMCDVLYYLHERNIIHRDIKPGNIMLNASSNNNSAGEITLIDFGIARTYKKGKTKDTVAFVTEAFAAPEQIKRLSQSDARTDIFSLGLTMYTLLTGKYPDETYKLEPITSIDNTLSDGLESIIIKCTQENPNDRYQNCLELMYDLEHYRENEERYLKKQRKKLAIFSVFVSLSILFLFLSLLFGTLSANVQQKNYDALLESASSAENCINAIGIAPERIEGYKKLWNDFYNDDSQITYEELSSMKKLFSDNSSIKEDSEFATLNYTIGEAVWFNYCGTEEELLNNKTISDKVKGDKAADFFQNVISYASDDSDDSEIKEYAQSFLVWNEYINIRNNADQTGDDLDSDTVLDGWHSLSNVVKSISGSEKNIIKLKMCSQVLSSIELNISGFKNAGVTQEDAEKTIDNIIEIIVSMDLSVVSNANLQKELYEKIGGTNPQEGDFSNGMIHDAQIAVNEAYKQGA